MIKAATKTTSDAIHSPTCLPGSKTKADAASKATKHISTSHPCQVQGGPQPQPYFLAGNQICFSFFFMVVLLPPDVKS